MNVVARGMQLPQQHPHPRDSILVPGVGLRAGSRNEAAHLPAVGSEPAAGYPRRSGETHLLEVPTRVSAVGGLDAFQ